MPRCSIFIIKWQIIYTVHLELSAKAFMFTLGFGLHLNLSTWSNQSKCIYQGDRNLLSSNFFIICFCPVAWATLFLLVRFCWLIQDCRPGISSVFFALQTQYIKRVRTIAKKMRCNDRIRMHRARASGAVSLVRYRCFCCPGQAQGLYTNGGPRCPPLPP